MRKTEEKTDKIEKEREVEESKRSNILGVLEAISRSGEKEEHLRSSSNFPPLPVQALRERAPSTRPRDANRLTKRQRVRFRMLGQDLKASRSLAVSNWSFKRRGQRKRPGRH